MFAFSVWQIWRETVSAYLQHPPMQSHVDSVICRRKCSLGKFRCPLVQEWPIDGACAKVCHVLIAVETVNRGLQQFAVVSKYRTVTGKQPFDTAGLNAFERINERGNIGSVMAVDAANSTVSKNVVP